ncbi:hypothetical protein vBPaerPs25_44 [Pseudomonas phage vB_Paer_Ps25]|uniref:Uncharacterized protein n=1 Tax=Pseudomonas phage vB_Paer_Ps12 TaxID=2924904 RepID=A0A9Y1CBM7_9CAUD|nr:hypothetical protein QE347_gp044 [Pseudomonas phage vB_Paer_Ps12]UOL47500.1 hypothetical protein vBPaerPs12_44 [Pseudomonas phage vB_Paer_Ps12]UOL47688.1 hypothetical protein vBPaerPs25_44 [Pseudomonas phage vB_Paer_Ps25]
MLPAHRLICIMRARGRPEACLRRKNPYGKPRDRSASTTDLSAYKNLTVSCKPCRVISNQPQRSV